jgi:branched-subunit amino acid transport protein
MSKPLYMFLMVLTMALVTYVIRMLPMVLFRKKIKSPFINSLLYYLPYAVLSAMTFPFILYSSGNIISASVGTAVALIGAFTRRSLVMVAIMACLAVLGVELVFLFFI